jgi:non-haem dioxygenase in morphine synthesis N-terminal
MRDIAVEIRDASINVGFFYSPFCSESAFLPLIRKLLPVTGHGIPHSVISGAFTAAKNFFALSESTKLEVRIVSQQRKKHG